MAQPVLANFREMAKGGNGVLLSLTAV